MKSQEPFRGPLSDGPSPEMLESVEPDLSQIGLSEVGRVLTVAAVMIWFVVKRCGTGLLRRLRGHEESFSDSSANGVIDAFMHLGPTYVKLGQVMASSPGLFPEWIAGPARRCLDEAPTFPAELVRQTIVEDLGRPIEQIFESFENIPLSAASIGQVHGCVLKDGREAVVKVQRPNLREQMTMDLKVLYLLARVGNRSKWGRSANVIGMVQDLSRLTAKELNPVVEAWNQQRYRDHLWVFGDNSLVTAPEVYWEYCGPRVICMERVHGIPMDDFETIKERGIDGELVLRRGAKAWAEAVMVHGPFHGDMHAGNIWILDDGRGCFLDFGIMGELDPGWRDVMRDIYFTCVFDKDFTRVAAAYRRVGVFPEGMGTDEEIGAAIGAMVNPLISSGMGSVSLGDLISSALVLMKEYGGTPPQELMLVAKQLLYIERYTKELAPDYAVISDPFLVKNIFPEAAKDLAASIGTVYPD